MYENHDHIRQLVLEKLTGSISEEDNAQLAQLLEADPAARDLCHQLETQAGALDLQGVLGRANESVAAAALQQKLPVKRGRIVSMMKWPAAAAIVLAIGGGWWFYQHQAAAGKPAGSHQVASQHVKLLLGNGKEVVLSANGQQVAGSTTLQSKDKELHYTPGNETVAAFNTLVVPAKEDYKIVLSDGTTVWLNSASSLRFPFAFNGSSREVYLEGEAYFKVAHRAQQPFIVHTGHTDIRVYGTSFNINGYEKNQLRASLVEGKIGAYANNDSVRLQPGMEVVSNGSSLRTGNFESSATLSWMEGLYYFSNIPLQDISGILSRWFDTQVVFDNPATAKSMVSGVIEKGKLEDFLENLKDATGIRHHWNGGILHLE